MLARSEIAPLQELLSRLQEIERDLNHLKDKSQGVDDTSHRIQLFRSIPRRRETKAAMMSVSLANDLIHTIRNAVQGHVYAEQKLLDTTR